MVSYYCDKCHHILQFVEKRDKEIAMERVYECPKCKYKIVIWSKK